MNIAASAMFTELEIRATGVAANRR